MTMKWIPVLASVLLAISPANLGEEEGIRRIKAHLLIDDPASALKEASELAERYPDSRSVQEIFIETLAAGKFEAEAFDAWHRLSLKYPDLLVGRHLLEELAWGVLKRGLDSTQNGVRLSALIGSYLTRDVRSVPILQKMMRDTNAVIRSVATQMSCSYRDEPLRQEVVRMMQEEKVWVVRLEVIKAAGALKIKELSPQLKAIVQSEKATYEERQLAIEALLNIYEDISLAELSQLANNDRAGMRHLACSIASYFEIEEAREIVMQLIHDPHPDVRIAALNAFGLFYKDKSSQIEAMEALSNALKESHPAVAITAAWAALLSDIAWGPEAFEKWIEDSLPENRRLAAAALAATGKKGAFLSAKFIKKSQDPYVKTNLALGLLGQRMEVEFCCNEIYEFMQGEKRMWMWDLRPNPLFRILAPSQVRYVDQIPNYPEAIDQMTRLNLFSLLAILEDSRAQEALKTFLQKRSWGISGVAAATLLQEGDETALEIVRQLLGDHDPNIQLQACLVLAMMGRDESVLSTLQGAYAGADHERKLQILEALGRMGTTASFSFLISVFREPFPILRVAAAAALIQCINR